MYLTDSEFPELDKYVLAMPQEKRFPRIRIAAQIGILTNILKASGYILEKLPDNPEELEAVRGSMTQFLTTKLAQEFSQVIERLTKNGVKEVNFPILEAQEINEVTLDHMLPVAINSVESLDNVPYAVARSILGSFIPTPQTDGPTPPLSLES